MAKIDVGKYKEFFARLFQKNKYEKILHDYEELSDTRPGDMRLKIKMAETYFKAKEIKKAVEVYDFVANHYVRENFILKAVAIYKNILKLDPALVEINIKLAELYLKLDMKVDAINQYRIVMQVYADKKDRDNLLDICHKMIELDSSPQNYRKLAEFYQAYGMTKEALEQYQYLAKIYRENKNYDDLLHVYEIILPHQQKNKALIKDICILYLRNQEPDMAIRTIERYKMEGDEIFVQLIEKAKLMKKALRSPQGLVAQKA